MLNFIVKWQIPEGTRSVVLHDWNSLNHLVTKLGIKEFSIEVFEYTK